MFANRLDVRPYQIADDRIGLDIKIPRHVFSNHLGLLTAKLSNLNEFMKSSTELATGSRNETELIYLSTTDPLISCALIPAAAWTVLQFYKLFLEVAEK
jgi:hypothetical protein